MRPGARGSKVAGGKVKKTVVSEETLNKLRAKFGLPMDATKEEVYGALKAKQREERERIELPHLYGWGWYKWAHDFYTSRNKITLLTAANQSSKSSTQIRKCIHWATDQAIWPSLWRTKPIQFWYLYPGQKQVNAEFQTKWKQFLPRGEMKDDEVYGWKELKGTGGTQGILFNSGVYVYFKTYAQGEEALQSGTVEALFCDEELPVELFDELMLRISASDGYFHMVFTATIGQEFWRLAMEPEEGELESLPQAFKQTVSLYDCMTYMDGSESHWTLEKIKQVEARCSTHQEVLKRVYGKFIMLEDRKYPSFDIKRHKKPKHPIGASWLIYEGVDIGGGGPNAHKSAICFVAVKPDFRQGRVFLGWRGGPEETTTAGDVFNKHRAMIKEHKLSITQKFYDWNCIDFGEIATRAGDPFEKAEKNHVKGEEIINTLFKNDMLFIYDDPELSKLCGELASLTRKGQKGSKKDDFADAFRYAITKIPWDWSAITADAVVPDETPEAPLTEMEQEIRDRQARFKDNNQSEQLRIEDEFNEWNEAYGD